EIVNGIEASAPGGEDSVTLMSIWPPSATGAVAVAVVLIETGGEGPVPPPPPLPPVTKTVSPEPGSGQPDPISASKNGMARADLVMRRITHPRSWREQQRALSAS